MDHKTLDSKVALITGSSHGIGKAIALVFAREGARVVVNGRDEQALVETRAEIESAGGQAIQVVVDVTRFAEIESMRLQVEKTYGPLDILVANAGTNLVMPGPLEAISEESWHATVEANLTTTFLTIKSFLPGMLERKSGNIITISSAAARRPTARSPIPYTAAKAGIQALTQILATQVGPFGIRANCIAPESILTESNILRIPDDQKAAMVQMHPIKRLGTPEDVAQAALYLASDMSSWVSGIILDVAGGSVLP